MWKTDIKYPLLASLRAAFTTTAPKIVIIFEFIYIKALEITPFHFPGRHIIKLVPTHVPFESFLQISACFPVTDVKMTTKLLQ